MEKKKSIVFKKITVSILSILFVVYAYLQNIPKVNALSNVITYNQYGSFERVNYKETILGTGISFAGLVGNLQGKYSGSLSININLNGHSLSEFSVIPTNCWITYYDSTVINIQFNDVSQFEVLLTSTTLDATATVTINSLTNWNMNMITYGDNYMQQHIYTSVDQIESYIDNVETLLTTNNSTLSRCETLLTTISQNGTSGGSSTVNNIDVNVGQIDVNLAYVKASTDSILSSLLGFLNDSLGQIITLETLIEHIDDVTNELTTLNTTLTNIDTTLTGMLTTLNNINSTVSNIDNTIDTISWSQLTINEFIGISSDNSNYITTGSISLSNKTVYVKFTMNTNDMRGDTLYKVRLPIYYYKSGTSDYDITISGINNRIVNLYNMFYYNTGVNRYLEIYFTVSKTRNITDVIFAINGSGTIYINNSATTDIKYIRDTDIEYWQLLQYFEQYNSNKKLLDAIKSISMEVTQQDITNTNNNINNYNTTMNTVEGIETNFINNLNTDLSNLNLTTQYVNPVDTNVRTAFDVVVKDVILDNNNFAGPFYLILICSVVLIFLGRF